MATEFPPSDGGSFTRAVRSTLHFVSQNRGKLLRWFATGMVFMGISTFCSGGFDAECGSKYAGAFFYQSLLGIRIAQSDH